MCSREDLSDLAALEIPGEPGTQEEEREAADAGDEDNLTVVVVAVPDGGGDWRRERAREVSKQKHAGRSSARRHVVSVGVLYIEVVMNHCCHNYIAFIEDKH